jgi:hypothetical protein
MRCVIGGGIIRQQVAKVPFIQHGDMVQAFASNRSNLACRVRPDRQNHRLRSRDPHEHGLQTSSISLGIPRSPPSCAAPAGNGSPERFIRILKENLL